MEQTVVLESPIVQFKDVARGDQVGYGATYQVTKPERHATLAVGYADGYHRAASGSGVPLSENGGGGFGFLNGCKVPIVGRISMDLTAFDITDVPDGSVNQGNWPGKWPGDWIELISENIPVEGVAANAGTIDYEVLTSLGRRFARSYING
jgi:alanine racemase